MQAPTGDSGRHSLPKSGQSEGFASPDMIDAADAVLGEQRSATRRRHRGGVDPEAAARVRRGPTPGRSSRFPRGTRAMPRQLPATDVEHLPELLERRPVPLLRDAARVAVHHLGAALRGRARTSSSDRREDVERLEAGHHHRRSGPRGEGLEDPPAGDGRRVAGGDEPLDVRLLRGRRRPPWRPGRTCGTESTEKFSGTPERSDRRGGDRGGLEAAARRRPPRSEGWARASSTAWDTRVDHLDRRRRRDCASASDFTVPGSRSMSP